MSAAVLEVTRVGLSFGDLRTATGGAWLVAPAPQASLPEPPPAGAVSIDSRTIEPGQVYVAIAGPRYDGHDFLAQALARGAAAAVVHRDVPAAPSLPLLRVADTTRALGEIAKALRTQAAIPVVGITGSVGKTTTKEITTALLATRGAVLKTEANLNNQYGLPLTLLRLRGEHTAAVLELGMSAAGELRGLSRLARPDIAVITLVAPVHLEFFASLDAIAAAKAEILEGLGPAGVAVLNWDDPRLRALGQARAGEVLWFGLDRSCHVSAERWRGTLHGMRFELRVGARSADVALPLAGRHNLANFLAAVAVADRLGVPLPAIVEAAAALRPARHRGEVLALGEGVTLLDDCYNSNPTAVEAAVAALALAAKGRRVAFLGDMLELGPSAAELHVATGQSVAERLDVLVAVGLLATHFLKGAHSVGERHAFPDAAAASSAAAELVRPGDAVLVKGSRGVRMEAIVDALVARFGVKER